jgi:hypothetical protein
MHQKCEILFLQCIHHHHSVIVLSPGQLGIWEMEYNAQIDAPEELSMEELRCSSLRDFVWIYQPCMHSSPQHYLGMSTGGEVSESGPVCSLPVNKPSTAPVLHFAHALSSPSTVTLT